MSEKKIRCMRCRGRKQIYKVGSGYSFVDMGGLKVDCPMCKGEGMIESLEEFKNGGKDEAEPIAQSEKTSCSEEEKIEDDEVIAGDSGKSSLSTEVQKGLHLVRQTLDSQTAKEASKKYKGKKK